MCRGRFWWRVVSRCTIFLTQVCQVFDQDLALERECDNYEAMDFSMPRIDLILLVIVYTWSLKSTVKPHRGYNRLIKWTWFPSFRPPLVSNSIVFVVLCSSTERHESRRTKAQKNRKNKEIELNVWAPLDVPFDATASIIPIFIWNRNSAGSICEIKLRSPVSTRV